MRDIINLNFNWHFSLCFNNNHIKDFESFQGFQLVDIPHTNFELPYNYFSDKINEFVSTYKKELEIKKSYQGKILNLIFEGVAHSCEIYINNSFVLKHEGGYDEFAVEITEYVKYNEANILTVVVDNHENPDIPPFGNVVDYLGYGGIYREVRLEVLEPEHIKSCFLKNNDISTNDIICDIELSIAIGELEILVFSANELVYENRFSIEDKPYVCSLNSKVLWSVDNPHLYLVVIKLITNNCVRDEMKIRFGFRKIEFTKQGFFLNNLPLKLRGLNRHQSYPYVGYAMPKRAQEKDAEILKFDLGVNIVRTSHYMQSKHFLHKCDEIGLLVFEEIPGWQYIGNDNFKENTYKNVASMIRRDFNHPSIIMWGVRINESPDDNEFYQKTNKIAHSLDQTRPTGGVRNFKNSEMFEDVYTFNDFIHSGGKDILSKPRDVKKGVPYLVTEFNGHMYPTKQFDDEAHRVEHALRHYKVIEEASKCDEISGTIGWCMNDYNTHQEFGSGDYICYHGVLDMYRLPKYASYIYSSQQSLKPVLEVLSSINFGEYQAGVLKNIYVATNLDYVKLYKNNLYINTFYPSETSKLTHPIIVISDLIGKQLEENEGFSKKDAKRAKKLFLAVNKYGYNLPFKYKISMLLIMKNNRLKLSDAVNLYFKYYTGVNSYRFEGYLGDKLIKTVIKENMKSFNYHIQTDDDELIVGETYDVTRIVVSKVDQNENLLSYAFDAMNIIVHGGLDLIGPSNISLIGGRIAFWVKTNNKSDEGYVEVIINKYVFKKTIKIK